MAANSTRGMSWPLVVQPRADTFEVLADCDERTRHTVRHRILAPRFRLEPLGLRPQPEAAIPEFTVAPYDVDHETRNRIDREPIREFSESLRFKSGGNRF